MPQKKSEKEKSYEEAISRLEEIAFLLERGDASLDDSVTLFDEAVSLIAFCDGKLKDVKQKIEAVSVASAEDTDV